jgi:hypothetical protein
MMKEALYLVYLVFSLAIKLYACCYIHTCTSNPCVWCSWTDQSANARPKQVMVGACSAAVTIKVTERKKEIRRRSHYPR